jgi:acyl-CoA synthetase (AMP-forming)/AMP-acid ligase II
MARGLLDPFGLLEAVRSENISGLHLNPGIMQMLLNTLGDNFPSLAGLRYVLFLGQPLTRQLVSAVSVKCPNARIMNGYGCTENSPRIAMKFLDDCRENGNDNGLLPVGKAVSGTEFTILDQQGMSVDTGVRGEVAIRGKSLMRGYLGPPEIMRERMANGWFRTRDFGFVDERGDLYIVGRVDNIIRVGHEKVSPEDVEEEILCVQGVLDVAVGGVPDKLLFEVPAALITHQGDFERVVNDVKSRIRHALSRSRMPRHFHEVAKIPRTSNGKIDRSRVAALLQDLHRAG